MNQTLHQIENPNQTQPPCTFGIHAFAIRILEKKTKAWTFHSNWKKNILVFVAPCRFATGDREQFMCFPVCQSNQFPEELTYILQIWLWEDLFAALSKKEDCLPRFLQSLDNSPFCSFLVINPHNGMIWHNDACYVLGACISLRRCSHLLKFTFARQKECFVDAE